MLYERPVASPIMHMYPEPGTITAVQLDFFLFFLFSDGCTRLTVKKELPSHCKGEWEVEVE